MKIYKKLFSFISIFLILSSLVNSILPVCAVGSEVKFELNGGTLSVHDRDYFPGDALPTADEISKAGFSFAGWYSNAELIGNRFFGVSADNATYYARWIVPNSEFDSFDSYATDGELSGAWSDWRYPAVNSKTTLNTEPVHSYSGNSLKVCPNKANVKDEIVLQKNLAKKGTGISFWIEATSDAAVQVLFNHYKDKSLPSPIYAVPSGKHIISIPWTEIEGSLQAADLWQLSFSVSVSDANGAIYIDSVGTYYVENNISFNIGGGAWRDGYLPPAKYIPGMALPNSDDLQKEGFVFAGWCGGGITDECYSYVPDTATGDISYCARWIILNTNFDDFDSYNSDTELFNRWTDWKSPAVSSVTALNKDPAHAYSGYSVRVCPNETEKAGKAVAFADFPKDGVGIAFWTESPNGATVQIEFNNKAKLVSGAVNVPAGKRFTAVPWSVTDGISDISELWQISISVSVPNADDAVYIDSIGTYCVESKISFNTGGGSWTDGYVPSENYLPGEALPNSANIKKEGFVFAGWCDSEDVSGEAYFSVPSFAAGEIAYLAKWTETVLNEDYETFDSFKSSNELLGSWSDWKWPAVKSEMTLNTDSAYSYSGNSLKFCPKEANVKGEIVFQQPSFARTGGGISFWIESTSDAAVQVLFNHYKGKSLPSPIYAVQPGKHIISIPWEEFDGALQAATLWQLSFLISVSDTDGAVYIDSIGTYYTDSISFNNGGGSWTDGYKPPERYTAGTVLPTADDIKRNGFAFAGWYSDRIFSGEECTAVPKNTTGDITYYARWVAVNAGFDSFDSYGTTEELLRHWSDWKWPAENSETVLNAEAAHSYIGNSLKVTPNAANSSAEVVLGKNFTITGDGISFWIESPRGASVQILLNHTVKDKVSKSLPSPIYNLSAGKRTVTVPWSEIKGAATADYLWQISILVSVPYADDSIFIDELGTYSEIEYEGDADLDGVISSLDLAVLRQMLFGVTPSNGLSDVNGDKKTDLKDLIALKKKLADVKADENASDNPLRRGVNFSGFEFSDEIGYDNWIFGGKYYDIVREKGFDHIRLPVDFFPRMGGAPDYKIDPDFLRKIDTVINTALHSDLKIVLDFHHFGELQTNVKGNKQKYYKMWEQLSEHYKDYPSTLVFELLNEPGNAGAISGGGPDVFTPAKILEIQEEAIKIIRKTNPTRLIVHATSWNDGAAQLMDTEPLLPNDDNIIMSVHSYEPLTFTHQGADWDGDGIYYPAADFTDDMKAEILDIFKMVKEYREKYNRPVWVGEFGVLNRITPDGARAKYADFIVDVMKEADCGWCWWEFQLGFRLYSIKNDKWVDDALMAALLK